MRAAATGGPYGRGWNLRSMSVILVDRTCGAEKTEFEKQGEFTSALGI
ncbi:MAG: hypothetical protein ACOX3A_08290 [bacterium]